MRYFLVFMFSAVLFSCSTPTSPGIAIGPNGPLAPGENDLGEGLLPDNPFSAPQTPQSPYKTFELAYEKSVKETGGQAEAMEMLDAGFTYADLLCDRFFNSLANQNQDLGFGIEGANILSGFTSAVLGLTGSPAKSVALTSTGFAATIAGMEAYQSHFFFGPDVATVRELITDGQTDYKSKIPASEIANLNHYKAVVHIRKMQSICQVDSILDYVNTAVQNQKIEFSVSGRNELASQASVSARFSIAQILKLPTAITNQELVNLYVLLELRTSEDERKFLYKYLGTIAKNGDLIDNAGKLPLAGFQNRQEITRIISGLPLQTRKLLAQKAKLLLSEIQDLPKDKSADATTVEAMNETVSKSSQGVSEGTVLKSEVVQR